MIDFFITPFMDYVFLRRALMACLALALGCGPVGVLLVLRRMSLMGDALAHAILPGAAFGFLVGGLSLPAMGCGGFLVGFLVALLAGAISRFTILNEDASFAGFYLISLAIGVLMISTQGTQVDLMHILFGTVLAVDKISLIMVAGITSFTLCVLALIYRPLLIECFDSGFLRVISGWGSFYHFIFLVLVTLNLVSAFQALGTLMALGMMMLPAVSSRLWARHVWSLFLLSSFFAIASGYFGLLLSYHLEWPSGPSIILIAGLIYGISLVFAPFGILKQQQGID
ncbi:MAG: metal ABC transporter permease [Alphaproteobacteria bacterium]|jgi:zinc/manganese transport system permease protein|nr:metal ABC transporter permease [Alphaproteobacteria bacterium]MBP7729196.1 metal ABC transporter permease [Alphaproteobacteria bacterium]